MIQWARKKLRREPITLALSASKPDNTDPQNHVVIVNWFLLGLVILFGVVIAIFGTYIYLQAVKPTEQLIVDRCSDTAPYMATSTFASEFTIADARNFFVNMARRRYAWSSASIARDVEEFAEQSMADQREADIRYYSEQIEVPGDTRRTRKPRLEAYASCGAWHSLVFPPTLERIKCVRDPAAGARPPFWHCEMKVTLLEEFLGLGDASRVTMPDQKLYITGTFMEAKRTPATPFGLLVGRMSGHIIDGEEDS